MSMVIKDKQQIIGDCDLHEENVEEAHFEWKG